MGEGERRPGIHCVRIRCYYSDIELSDYVVHGCCLVHLPFDLNLSCSMYLHVEMAGLDSSNLEQDFEVRSLSDIAHQLTKTSKQCLARSLVQRSGGHPIHIL